MDKDNLNRSSGINKQNAFDIELPQRGHEQRFIEKLLQKSHTHNFDIALNYFNENNIN